MKFYESVKFRSTAEALLHKWKTVIESELPSSRVEHIGATAVDGALTKGDIDLYIEVPPADHQAAISVLEDLGFRVKEDTHRDTDLCMLESTQIDGPALQVVARGSIYEFFLTFRNALANDKALLERYNQLKLSCCNDSEEEYRTKKADFIEGVLRNL